MFCYRQTGNLYIQLNSLTKKLVSLIFKYGFFILTHHSFNILINCVRKLGSKEIE